MLNTKTILKLFQRSFPIKELASELEKKTISINGLKGSAKALFIASLIDNTENGIVFVTKNNRDAQDLFNDLCIFLREDNVFLFPSNETLPYDESEPYKEIVIKRIMALDALVKEEKKVFVLPARGFTEFFLPRDIYLKSIIEVDKEKVICFSDLEKDLVGLGYEREDRVTYGGSFSIRGDIVDIFTYDRERPVRIEFFDEVVESIREFSPSTQRSLKDIEHIRIIPAREVIVNQSAIDNLERIKNIYNGEIIDNILELNSFSGIKNYLSLVYENPSTILDYTKKNYIFIFDALAECIKNVNFFKRETVRIYNEKKDKCFILPPEKLINDFESILSKISNYSNITIMPEKENNFFDFDIMEKKGYRGQIKSFKKDLEDLLIKGYRVIVGAAYEGQTNRIRSLLQDLIDRHQNLDVLTLDLNEGFVSHKMKFALILDREIFNRKRRFKKDFIAIESRPIEGILDIKNGDFIVHIDHGIGIYRGIEKLKAVSVEKDFVKIEYRDNDEIFVPVDQINLIQKYMGQEGRIPRIDKIGSGIWKQVKEHVKRSVKNFAKELLEIYSTRASLEGYAFSQDNKWQHEFESGFRYEETDDQIRTIQEVKNDMESSKPMDRLICGDVGFGKTEVAVRAAFKAVMDGKQVAVLVPTTILAEQHLNTFKDRFASYPINVEMLSRFKTPKEQKEIVKHLKDGLIDVVIGTHRLIQKDVGFRDLGLAIIDEEQRFGVEHKERLKRLRRLVDVITMTATPIPRTLYMSMGGIRDMSVIETAPMERIPIETYVREYNEEVVKDAIRREIERDGQVYYVHNRVNTIEERKASLSKCMPGISFEVAHGRMDENELEEIMKAFFDREFEVLVTTTIIESGLDIPNVNTIIIERADRFGLAQLYQLRGRVGRSKRKAYAYLFHLPNRILTEQAQKRLSIINDHTELGSGYSIAMKDLELRGAGNILGREQHGDMLAVGFELWVKLLDEAIEELKAGGKIEEEIKPIIDVKYRGFIPTYYVKSERLRIEIYKRLSDIKDEEELEDLREELIDRFGSLPKELLDLISIIKLKILCINVGIKSIEEKENELKLTFSKSKVDIINILSKINKNKRMFRISPKNYNVLYVYRTFRNTEEKLEFLKDLFIYEEKL